MNERVISQYCRSVGRKLKCGRAQRKRLLDGLAQELTEEFAPSPVTQARLIALVGAPASTAEQLQESVGSAERAAFEKKRKWVLIAAIVLVFILLASIPIGYIVYWESYRPTYYTRTVIVDSNRNNGIQHPSSDDFIRESKLPADS